MDYQYLIINLKEYLAGNRILYLISFDIEDVSPFLSCLCFYKNIHFESTCWSILGNGSFFVVGSQIFSSSLVLCSFTTVCLETDFFFVYLDQNLVQYFILCDLSINIDLMAEHDMMGWLTLPRIPHPHPMHVEGW